MKTGYKVVTLRYPQQQEDCNRPAPILISAWMRGAGVMVTYHPGEFVSSNVPGSPLMVFETEAAAIELERYVWGSRMLDSSNPHDDPPFRTLWRVTYKPSRRQRQWFAFTDAGSTAQRVENFWTGHRRARTFQRTRVPAGTRFAESVRLDTLVRNLG